MKGSEPGFESSCCHFEALAISLSHIARSRPTCIPVTDEVPFRHKADCSPVQLLCVVSNTDRGCFA